ncbi:NAD(P)-dependent oxidoreductase [Sporosarcina limicola]|uniref:NAD(P)-dependent oxidoreductase n=1 Tax=Sporosarcina limicola TaxID=34101 RepID=UPI00178AA142
MRQLAITQAEIKLDAHWTLTGFTSMGRIGEAVARRAKGLDMHVFYVNHNKP